MEPARTKGKTGITLLGARKRPASRGAATRRTALAAPSGAGMLATAREEMLAARGAVASAQLAAAAQIEAGVLEAVAALKVAPSAAAEKTLLRISKMLRGAPSGLAAPTWSDVCTFLAAKEPLRKAVALLDPVNCCTGSAAVAAVAAAAAAAAEISGLSSATSSATSPSEWTWSATEQLGWGVELKESNMMIHLTRAGKKNPTSTASSTTAGARGTDGWTSGTHTWAVKFEGSGTGTHGAVGICTEAKGVLWLGSYDHLLGGSEHESWGWHKDGNAMYGKAKIGDLPKYGSGDSLEMHLDCTGAAATLSFSKNGTPADFKFTDIPLDEPVYPAACTPMSSGKIVLVSRSDSSPEIAVVAAEEDDACAVDARTAAASALEAERAAAARLVEDLVPIASLVDLLTAVDALQELVLRYNADSPRVLIHALCGGLSVASASASTTAQDAASPFAPLALGADKAAKAWRSAEGIAPVWWEVDFGSHAVPLHKLSIVWSRSARPTDWAICCLHDDGGRFKSILAGVARPASSADETGAANRSGWRVVRRFRNEALRERSVLLLPAARARKLRLVVYASTSSASELTAAAADTEANASDASVAEAPWSVGLDAVSIHLAPFSLRGARAEDYQRIPIRSRSQRQSVYGGSEEASSKCGEVEEESPIPRVYEEQVVTLHNLGVAQGGLDALLSGAEHRATHSTLCLAGGVATAQLASTKQLVGAVVTCASAACTSPSANFAIERLAPGRNGVPNDEAVWAITARNGSETCSGFKKLAHTDAESCANGADGTTRGSAAIIDDDGAQSQWQLIPANDSVRTVAPTDAPWQFRVKTHLYAGASFRTAAEDEAAYVPVARPQLPDVIFFHFDRSCAHSLAPHACANTYLPLHSPVQVRARACGRRGDAPARRGRSSCFAPRHCT